jgi:sensor histidine kinase regulating citrate/malate metabolism
MKRTIRIICIIGAFVCFALSTTDLDIHKGKEEKLQDHEKQTAYQETAFIAE